MGIITSHSENKSLEDDTTLPPHLSNTIDIAILGPHRVGKSCIFHAIGGLDASLMRTYIPTIGFDHKNVDINGVNVSLWDTVGSCNMTANINDHLINTCSIFLLVFSQGSMESLLACRSLFQRILRIRDTKPCIVILVGTHGDANVLEVTPLDIENLQMLNPGTVYFGIADTCVDVVAHLEEFIV